MSGSGFTLVEVVVAIVVLAIGILATVSTSVLVERMIVQSFRWQTAAELAWSHSELVRATAGCVPRSGSAVTGQFTTSWHVTSRSSTDLQRIVVQSPQGTNRLRSDTFLVIVPCG